MCGVYVCVYVPGCVRACMCVCTRVCVCVYGTRGRPGYPWRAVAQCEGISSLSCDLSQEITDFRDLVRLGVQESQGTRWTPNLTCDLLGEFLLFTLFLFRFLLAQSFFVFVSLSLSCLSLSLS